MPCPANGAVPEQLTVTVAVQVLLLLLASDTVSVTTLRPLFAQVNVLGLTESNGGVVQASVLMLSTCDGSRVNVFPGTSGKVTALHFATGLVKSLTVTVAVQVLVTPEILVAVNVTVLGPTFEQLKLVLLSDKVNPLLQ